MATSDNPHRANSSAALAPPEGVHPDFADELSYGSYLHLPQLQHRFVDP